jgi:putative transposase
VSGRKRHIVVDTLGLLLAVVVHPANIQDRDGAKLVLTKLAGRFPRLWLLWADGAYAGALLVWALVVGGWVIELVKKPEGATTFAALPKRWIVERTFAWLGRCRRLSKDYEALSETSETWIHIAMLHLMLKRLAPR